MWRAAAEAGAMGHLDELQMHINKLKLRWPYKPKITVPLLVLSVSLNLLPHPTPTVRLVASVGTLVLMGILLSKPLGEG